MSWNKGGDNGGPWGKPPGGGSNNQGGGRGPGGGGFPPANDNIDELLKKAQDRVKDLFSGEGGNNKMIAIALLAFVVMWMASGIYQVQPGESGVVMRFGDFHRETGAGLRYHFPSPIESVQIVNTQLVRKESFGVQAQTTGNFEQASPVDDSLMLTGDENIIDITFDVQWNISSAQKYLFNVKNAPLTVRNVAESAMREVIGRTTFSRALTEGKSKIEQETRQLMQETLDSAAPGSYGAGIRIQNVNLVEAAAPAQVLEAFRDVQAARADQERSRNEAEAYRNDIIPRARGQAERLIQEAEGYRQQVIAQAEGDAARFNSVYNEYKQAPEVTRKRMYLETMERVMSGMNKVIVEDGKATQGVMPYLPLQGLQPKSAAPTGGQ
jgi:membrane protease subunit HflK